MQSTSSPGLLARGLRFPSVSLTSVLQAIRNTSIHSSLVRDTSSNALWIATHDGTFHCDEALACGLLKLLPEYSNACVVRSRNTDDLEHADIVVDVGGVCDPSRLRFDHHQSSFTETFHDASEDRIRLSSAGLVYKYFGRRILEIVSGPDVSEETLSLLYLRIYRKFFAHIDAIDNGIEASDGNILYHITTSLSDRVGRLNGRWNEDCSSGSQNNRFLVAMEVCVSEFLEIVDELISSWLPAYQIVEKAMLNATIDPDLETSGAIVLFDQFCPWKSHLLDIEEKLQVSGRSLFVIFPDTSGKWRVQTVPCEEGSFASRLSLPEPWRGLRDEELSSVTGIPGCIFTHATGFIGGHATREGAIYMAKAALNQK